MSFELASVATIMFSALFFYVIAHEVKVSSEKLSNKRLLLLSYFLKIISGLHSLFAFFFVSQGATPEIMKGFFNSFGIVWAVVFGPLTLIITFLFLFGGKLFAK